MNINELIKSAMQSYKEANASEKTMSKKVLDTIKMVKTAFMEYATNKKNVKQFDETDDVSVRITKIPEDVQNKLIEEMIGVRKNNVKMYTEAGRQELADSEQKEIDILEALLPKAATEAEIKELIEKTYPDGLSQKDMGAAMKLVKESFARVDGKMTSEIVRSYIK